MFAAGALVGVAALEPFVPVAGPLAVLLFPVLAGLVVVEWWAFLRARPARREGPVEVRRDLPRSLDLGEEAAVTLRLRNRLGLRVTVEIVENLPEALVTEIPFDDVFPARVTLPPLGTAEIVYRVRPCERGRVEIGAPWVRVGISKGLAVARTRPDCTSAARVVPSLAAVVRYDTLRRGRNLAALGIHVGRGFERGREFDRLRDYHVDDDYRDVDWKATARRDRPITRVFRPERSQDVIVAVDSSRVMTARSGGLSKLDEAVNAALVLAHVVTQGGDRFGLVVFDAEVRAWMAPRSGGLAVRQALDTLYDVAPSISDASFQSLATTLAARQTRRALVVVLTDLPDAVAGDDLVRCLPLLRRRHLVACFTTADRAVLQMAETVPADAAGLASSLAAAELLEEKRRARRRVADAGAHCQELPPGTLAANAVNRYLDAKSRGLL